MENNPFLQWSSDNVPSIAIVDFTLEELKTLVSLFCKSNLKFVSTSVSRSIYCYFRVTPFNIMDRVPEKLKRNVTMARDVNISYGYDYNIKNVLIVMEDIEKLTFKMFMQKYCYYGNTEKLFPVY